MESTKKAGVWPVSIRDFLGFRYSLKTSSNSSVGTLGANGFVTTISEGPITISVTITDGDFTASVV